MKLVKLIMPAFFLISIAALQGNAQSCQALLNDLINHASSDTELERKEVEFKIVGIREDSSWGMYATGVLDYTPGRRIGFEFTRPRFSGTATQYFSDRSWSRQHPIYPHVVQKNPFSPDATDQIKLSFWLGGNTALFNYGDLEFTLLSWGSTSSWARPECQGNYMIINGSDAKQIITFKKITTTNLL